MFEAVNSVISNAPLLRASADKVSSATLDLSQLEPITAPKAPYVSLFISVDLDFDKAVLQVRDADTGDVLSQFPSEETLASRQRRLESQNRVDVQASNSRADVQSSSSSFSDAGQIVAIQDASSSSASSGTLSQPQVAAAALSTASQSSAAPSSQTVSVQA